MNKYLRHIKILCQKHKITLVTGKAYDDYINSDRDTGLVKVPKNYCFIFSVPSERKIYVPYLNGPKFYVSALHEIGHILDLDSNCCDNQLTYAFKYHKVTKYILKIEYEASLLALKLNKHTPPMDAWKQVTENQRYYLRLYKKSWGTYPNPRRYAFPKPTD